LYRGGGRNTPSKGAPSVKKRLVLIATLVVTLGAASAGIAIAAGGDDSATETPITGTDLQKASAGGDDDATETRITGTDLQKASAAALHATGGGRVTGTEVGDEESYYEVEVTLDGGGQVDVQLDKSFNVVGSEGDHDGSGED
jgi:uncharacterized membrane protein YkoI